MRELERAEAERKRKEREERRRRERKNREAFTDLLREMHRDGKFSVKTRWRELKPNLKQHPIYKAMLGQAGCVLGDLLYMISLCISMEMNV